MCNISDAMDSIPFEFIEETLRRVHPEQISECARLPTFWGRYAQSLLDRTEHFQLIINQSALPELYFYLYRGTQIIKIEDVLKKKHFNIFQFFIINAPGVFPGAMKIENEHQIVRLLSRSNGLTFVMLSHWAEKTPRIAAFLQAVPRVRQMLVNPDFGRDVVAVTNLVEKHLQAGCLDGLAFGKDCVPETFFPLILTFLRSATISEFEVNVARENEGFAREMSRTIVGNWRKPENRGRRSAVTANAEILNFLKAEIAEDRGIVVEMRALSMDARFVILLRSNAART